MLVVGFIGGAALMYLFDPERGKRRRGADLARSGETATMQVSERGEQFARKAQRGKQCVNRVENTGQKPIDVEREAQNPARRPRSANVSDLTLQTRVQAQLGHYVADPGAISVTVNSGNVILGGKIHAREAQPLIERVRTIPGVKNVENRLELHDSSENVPNPQAGSNGTGGMS